MTASYSANVTASHRAVINLFFLCFHRPVSVSADICLRLRGGGGPTPVPSCKARITAASAIYGMPYVRFIGHTSLLITRGGIRVLPTALYELGANATSMAPDIG